MTLWAIRQAEPWTALSIVGTLFLVAAIVAVLWWIFRDTPPK
ncbi:MAG TPA: hypothetical protein VIL12_05830 [Acidimicrobiia bacterium]